MTWIFTRKTSILEVNTRRIQFSLFLPLDFSLVHLKKLWKLFGLLLCFSLILFFKFSLWMVCDCDSIHFSFFFVFSTSWSCFFNHRVTSAVVFILFLFFFAEVDPLFWKSTPSSTSVLNFYTEGDSSRALILKL